MKLDVVLGLQWGDEGKGKIVDVLAETYQIIARFQGGPNAGHSIHFDGNKYVLRSVPSGVFRKGTVNIVGSGVVLDPITFRSECEAIEQAGVPLHERLYISKKVHLILPTHKIIDAAQEASKGKAKIGSTLKGIGPAYTDKVSRVGLRAGDTLAANFRERFEALKAKHIEYLRKFDFEYDAIEHETEWLEAIEYLRKFRLIDGEYFANECLDKGKKILAEGAQGSMLDIDFGSYPFVTSSNTICPGACTGLGIAPGKVGRVYGIFKAYCTRVGSGPFPTELNDDTGEMLRIGGGEFGAVTGRPRRCGWLDLVALKYAIMLNGVTDLIMMKADVMDEFDTIKVATSYIVDGEPCKIFPFDTQAGIQPVYKEFRGWHKSISGMRRESELPYEFKVFLKFIEEELQLPVKIISVGPDREQTIVRED